MRRQGGKIFRRSGVGSALHFGVTSADEFNRLRAKLEVAAQQTVHWPFVSIHLCETRQVLHEFGVERVQALMADESLKTAKEETQRLLDERGALGTRRSSLVQKPRASGHPPIPPPRQRRAKDILLQ